MSDGHRWCSVCHRTYREGETVSSGDGSLQCPNCSADKTQSLVWSAISSYFGWPNEPEPEAVYDDSVPLKA